MRLLAGVVSSFNTSPLTMAARGPAYEACVKILMVGDSGTGKTCLLLRYAEGTFQPSFITTIGIDFIANCDRAI